MTYAKNLTLLASCLTLLGASVSCKRGPHIEWCLTGPDYFACSTANKHERKLELDKVDGYRCATPMATYAFMKACEIKQKPEMKTFCTWDFQTKLMGCPGDVFKELKDAQNYGCMHPLDLDKLATWCDNR